MAARKKQTTPQYEPKDIVRCIITPRKEESQESEFFGVNGKMLIVSYDKEVDIPFGIASVAKDAQVLVNKKDKSGNNRPEQQPRYLVEILGLASEFKDEDS